MSEDLIKEIVDILSKDEDEDGYDYDTVEAKKAVTNFFQMIADGDPEVMAAYFDDKGLV